MADIIFDAIDGSAAYSVRDNGIYNAITGRKMFTIKADGIYNAITDRRIAVFPEGFSPGSGGGTDVSGVTAQPADVLNTVKFVNSSGMLVNGTMQTVVATLSGNIVTVPAGHIASKQTLTVAEAAAPTVSGNVVTVNKGYQSAQKKIEVGTALAAKTYTPGSEPIIIKAGKYLTGDQTIEGIETSTADLANLTAENIKYGVEINGVKGTFSEEKYYPAEASCILSPFRAFVNGKYIQGTIDDLGVVAPYDGYYPQATDLVIPSAGKYCAEDIVVSGDANFKSENIREGVTIWGVEGTYKGESSGGDSLPTDGSVLTVTGSAVGSPGADYNYPEGDQDGIYRIVDATATGTDRKWKHESKDYWISYSYGWYISNREYFDATFGLVALKGGSSDNPWDSKFTLWDNWGSSADATVVLGGGVSGGGSGESGSSKPTPGAANAVVALKITYDNGTIEIISFSPEDLTASGNDRRWLGIHTPTGNVWTLLNEGDWCLKNAFSEYYLYGVISPDPWGGDWSTVKSNIGNVSIECTAIGM